MKSFLMITLLLLGSLTASAQSKIAHLNSQDVMAAMPSYNAALLKLEKFQQELIAELQAMKLDFEEHVTIYEGMVAKGGSQTLLQVQEQKLQKKQNDIIEREGAIQGEIEAYSRELNRPIVEKVNKAIKIVSDREGYDYVFDVSMTMIHNGPDITEQVIAEIIKLENQITPPPREDIRQN